jgi:CheY-like chemotaxis protein
MRPRVAVVDDDIENCRALSELLTTEGFDVVTFEGGEAAWSAMTNGQERPSVLIADVRMPGLDGVGLLRRIRARFPDVPVVLVSAFAEEAAWLEALAAGAVDVFPKPIRASALIPALRAAVGDRRGPERPIGDNPDPRPAGITARRERK